MKSYSEKTKRLYDTPEECLAAEEEFDKKLALAEAQKKELAETRASRAQEVKDAFQELLEADKKYQELLKKFSKDYGGFHATYQCDGLPISIFDLFLGML
jgi:hypothetical protein